MPQRIFASICFACLIGGLASVSQVMAQTAPTQIDPERIAAAKELLKTMGSSKRFDVMIKTLISGMARSQAARLPKKEKEIRAIFELLEDKFLARKSEIMSKLAPLWAEKFTTAEIKEVTNFFRSPIGRKVVREQIGIMQKGAQIGMRWGRKIGMEVAREAAQEFRKQGIK